MTTTKFRDLRDLRVGDWCEMRNAHRERVLSRPSPADTTGEIWVNGMGYLPSGVKSFDGSLDPSQDIISVTRRGKVIWRKDKPAAKPAKKSKPKLRGEWWPVYDRVGVMIALCKTRDIAQYTAVSIGTVSRRRVRWEEE